MAAVRKKAKRESARTVLPGNVLSAPATAGRAHADETLGLLRGLAAFVPGLVFQLRLRGNGSFCFPYASEAMREIFRLGPEDVREDGAKFLAMLHPSEVADFLRSIEVSARDLSRWSHEFRVSLENGRSRWLLGYAVPERDVGGDVLLHGFIGYAAGPKRARASQMRSEFLSVAAHALRTPVSIIYGFGETLLKQMLLNQNPDPARQREFLAIIAANMTVVSSIIGDLADLARLEARQGEDFIFAATDLGNLVREVVSVFATPAGYASPDLLLPTKPLFALVDRNQATQAIAKVLAHAYHCSLPGADMRVAVKAQGLSEAGGIGARMIGIRIISQGAEGNGEESKPSRGRFSRFDTSGGLSNMGLGMSVVREIADFHGGEVRMQSTGRRGTSIELLFPEAAKPKRTRRENSALRKNNNGSADTDASPSCVLLRS